MAWWLQGVLAIVLVVLCGFLVPLLLQMRRTAAAVERLAESAREDFKQVAGDVHHIRERADALADLAQASLEVPLGLSRIIAGVAQTMTGFVAREGLPWMGALVSGIKFVINFFRRPGKEAKTKEATHE
jgi:hypothetical protein